MEKNDLKRKLNRGFGQLSENIELKKIDPDRLGLLSEQELEDIFGIRKKKSYIPSYGYHALAAVASLVVLITGVFTYIDRSDHYTELDISSRPAVTLYLRDSRVKRVKVVDKDDSDIIRDLDKDQSLDDALDILLHRMDEKGYLKERDNKIDIVIKGTDKDNVERQVSSSLRKRLDEIDISVPVTINNQELNTAEKLYDMPADSNIQTTESSNPDNDSTEKENKLPVENTENTALNQTGQERAEDPAEATTENDTESSEEGSTADINNNEPESGHSDLNSDISEENDSGDSIKDQQASSSGTDSQVQTNTEENSSTKSTRAPGKKNPTGTAGNTANEEKKEDYRDRVVELH